MFNLYPKSLLKDTPNWLEIETERKRAYLQTFGARQPTNTQTHTETQRVSEKNTSILFARFRLISQGKRVIMGFLTLCDIYTKCNFKK